MGAFEKKDFEIGFVIHVCVSVGVLVCLFVTLAMCWPVPSSSPCWGRFEISNLAFLFLSVVLSFTVPKRVPLWDDLVSCLHLCTNRATEICVQLV